MNIHEIAERFSLSLTKLKRMEKAGLLICDGGEGHPLAPAMRAHLSSGKALSVEQLFALIGDPKIAAELRSRQGEARAQVKALGDFKADQPVPGMLNYFRDAGRNDPDSLEPVARWVKKLAPATGANYAWFAVRAASGITIAAARSDFLHLFQRALANCRKAGLLDGFYRVEKTGSRSVTIYFNPANEYDI